MAQSVKPSLQRQAGRTVAMPVLAGQLKQMPLPFMHGAMRKKLGLEGFDDLSMGSSHDYEVAIEEGATLVRIGTEIFGARSKE